MPNSILTEATIATCPHGLPVQFPSTASKVLIEGARPMLATDLGLVTGCPFTVPPAKPQPCVIARLTMTATKVLVEGRPVLFPSPSDLCQSPDQIPNGPAVYTKVQLKVVAS